MPFSGSNPGSGIYCSCIFNFEDWSVCLSLLGLENLQTSIQLF